MNQLYRASPTLLAGCAIALWATNLNATVFTIDDFWIVKNDTEVFRDAFDDGISPPVGPDGADTYSVIGAGGLASETAGRLTLDPARGTLTNLTATQGEFTTAALRSRSTSSSAAAFLGFDDAFSINGIFDLAGLPAAPGDSFGIRATDRNLGQSNPGNDAIELAVRWDIATGGFGVGLREDDFVNDSFEDIDFVALNDLLVTYSSAMQIQLTLSKRAGTDAVDAFFTLLDANLADVYSEALSTFSTATGDVLRIYDGENYTRAQFKATTSVPIPEPASFVLLAVGLGLLGFMRRTPLVLNRSRGHSSRVTKLSPFASSLRD